MIRKTQTYAGPDRRISKPSPVFIAFSVLAIVGVTFVTLCPIHMRPHFAPAHLERFGAYFVLGFVIAVTARRHFLKAATSVVVLAFVLEAGQLLTPGRDARVVDAIFKAFGGLSGVGAGYALFPLKRFANRLLQPAVRKIAPAPNTKLPKAEA